MSIRRTTRSVRKRPAPDRRPARPRPHARCARPTRLARPRRVAGVLLSAAAVLAATACTGGTPRTAQTALGDVPGEIVVASGRDVTGKGGVRHQLIDAWNREQQRKNTGFHARLVELPGSADEQRSQLLGALQSGSARYDVVNLDVTWVPEFAEAGLISPLRSTLVDRDVIPSVAVTARWHGTVYAVPFNSDVGLLFYRRDHLREAGVQQTDLAHGLTWQQLRSLGDTLEAHPPQGFDKTWTTQLDAYEGRTVNAVEAFASATDGFRLVDDSGHFTAEERQLEDGIAELRRRADTPYTLTSAFTSREDGSLGDFAAGRTAFVRHWPYVYRTLHQRFTTDQLGVAPLPGRAVLGGQNLAVTKTSSRQRKAAELVAFLTGPSSERCLLDAGFAATRISAYTDDDVTCTAVGGGASASPSRESTDRMPRDSAGRPAYARSILLPALRTAVQRPRTPLYGAFTQTFAAELEPLFSADPPSDRALARRLYQALREVLPN
ncbi:extracellular solute-binding protein [Streptomyces sp. WAC00469]|uniref:extracellular solute-binding protein n=1 Tax=Streptomyces sp. WAC00469 TaxID=2487415 RepID=UPI000F746D2B|nr:extracellular solute-binding protein [Streptomyces sp. WAC00469]RSR98999.1 extracellular solute-binding protein [Streptomyces sp. WAC00469]